MNQQPVVHQKPKIKPWLWIVLIIVVLGAGAFFYWNFIKNSSTSPATQVSASPDELSQSQSDINKMEGDLNQLDNINAAEDNQLTL